MPLLPDVIWSGARIDPVFDPESMVERPVNLKASTTYPAGTLIGELIGTDEEVTVTLATPTSGSWKFIFGAQTSAAIPYNATAAEAQAIVEALSTIGVGNIRVLKDSALVYRFIFRNALGSTNVGTVTTDATLLVGGAGTAVVAVATAGVAGTPGTYGPYASGNTDGSQNPKGLLRYACITDASGNITIGDGPAGTSEWGRTFKYIDMAASGYFRTDDVIGLDAAGLAKIGRLINGTLAHGVFVMTGA